MNIDNDKSGVKSSEKTQADITSFYDEQDFQMMNFDRELKITA